MALLRRFLTLKQNLVEGQVLAALKKEEFGTSHTMVCTTRRNPLRSGLYSTALQNSRMNHLTSIYFKGQT